MAPARPLSPREVEKIVTDALTEVQTLGGHPWEAPDLDAPLIGTLDGFDSLIGLEATVMVEKAVGEKLGIVDPVNLGMESIFVSKDGRKALSLREVVKIVGAAVEALS